MNIQRLAYFLSLSKCLNFTRAAEECGIAQTAMSRHIALLERELGVILFLRDNKRVQLTEEGKSFYSYAAQIVELYKDASQQMEIAANNRKYSLRIGIGPYENYLLAPVLENFNDHFPQINLSCHQYSYEQLSTQLAGQHIDLMFCIDHCADRVKEAERFQIYSNHWGVISCVGHPICRHNEVTHHHVSGETVVTMCEYNFYDYQRNLERKGCTAKGFIRVNTHLAKLLFVRAGLGLAFVPAFSAEDLAAISYTPLEKDSIPSAFVCAYLPEKNNKLFRAFLEHVKKMVQ